MEGWNLHHQGRDYAILMNVTMPLPDFMIIFAVCTILCNLHAILKIIHAQIIALIIFVVFHIFLIFGLPPRLVGICDVGSIGRIIAFDYGLAVIYQHFYIVLLAFCCTK